MKRTYVLLAVIVVASAFGAGLAVAGGGDGAAEDAETPTQSSTRVQQLERENDRLRMMLNNSRDTNRELRNYLEDMNDRTVSKSRAQSLKAQLNASQKTNRAYREQIQTRGHQLVVVAELERKTNSTDVDGDGYVNGWEVLKDTDPQNATDYPSNGSDTGGESR